MPEIKNQLTQMHRSKQRGQHILLIYALISLVIADYIAHADILFGPYVKDMLGGADNKYSVNSAMLADLVIVLAVLFPFFLLVKMISGKKYQDELTEGDDGKK